MAAVVIVGTAASAHFIIGKVSVLPPVPSCLIFIIYVPILGFEKASVVGPVNTSSNKFPIDKSNVVVVVEFIAVGCVNSKVFAFTFEDSKSAKVNPVFIV